MKQRLIWLPEAEDTGKIAKQVPLVDYDGDMPKRLWSLYLETDKTKPPLLPFVPRHHVNAFLEDHIHDWDIENGKLRYYSRATEGNIWALLEFEVVVGCNLKEPIMKVKHSELSRISENSAYKSECPKCETGMLVTLRDKAFQIKKFDHCLLCGQRFEYLDIDDLRKK